MTEIPDDEKGYEKSDENELGAFWTVDAGRPLVNGILPGLRYYIWHRRGMNCEVDVKQGGNVENLRPLICWLSKLRDGDFFVYSQDLEVDPAALLSDLR